MTEIADALRDTLLDLARIPSPIGEEAELCDHVEARLTRSLGGDAISRFHDSLIVRAARRQNGPRIALVGHLDTVCTEHDGPARVEGNRLYGAGAADMKSGLAIMIELVVRELKHEIEAYDDFCEFRDSRGSGRRIKASSTDMTREKWLAGRREALQSRMRRRRKRRKDEDGASEPLL